MNKFLKILPILIAFAWRVDCFAVDYLEGSKDLVPGASRKLEGATENTYEKDGVQFTVSDQYLSTKTTLGFSSAPVIPFLESQSIGMTTGI